MIELFMKLFNFGRGQHLHIDQTENQPEEYIFNFEELSDDFFRPQITHTTPQNKTQNVLSTISEQGYEWLKSNFDYSQYRIIRKTQGYFSFESGIAFKNADDAAFFKMRWMK